MKKIPTPPARLAPRALMMAVFLAVTTPFVLAACGDKQPPEPSGRPSITGIVKTATAGSGGAVGSFLVVQGTGDYDKASVAATADTAWYRANGDKIDPIEAPGTDALIGKRVEVRFTGAVAESYPVQATAGWVVVRE